MADILKSLGDAIERQQQRRHENNREVLRAIYTRPGMIVLGMILLGAALALIWPQIALEADNTNSIVIDMSDFDFGDEEMNRTVQEMVENDRKQKERPHYFDQSSVGRATEESTSVMAFFWASVEPTEPLSCKRWASTGTATVLMSSGTTYAPPRTKA